MTPIHFPFQPGWILLPGNILRGFNGASQLPEYELDRATVIRQRGRVRPLTGHNTDLPLNAWQLAHSIKKADCARGISSFALHWGAVGFLIDNFNLFDWSPDNLRLNNGMADFYADFTRTGLSGRVAQGMAIMFMENRGYSFGGIFSTFLKSANGQAAARQLLKTKVGQVVNPKMPDFIFEEPGGAKALAESKGGFSSPGTSPGIKGDLRDALEQLEGWDRIIYPQPSKSFAVGTYLRESDDMSAEPSLVAFVDPPPNGPLREVEYPSDLVRRCNYAGWFAGMGLPDAARQLQRAGEDFFAVSRQLPILTLGRHRYAFAVISAQPLPQSQTSFDKRFWLDLEDLFYSPHFFHDGLRLEIMGVELRILKLLSKFLHTKKSGLLMKIEPIIEKEIPQRIDEGKFFGSVFSDGTLFGELRVSSPKFGGIAFEEIEL